ncbi:MAG: ATP-binding protein [Candidatus Nomurabacteria bacterium]|jgi:predicted AAA+ superfamily ATPase|nr:ATP-binding protein [Candidatus Nomurabacteria bacterium]
MFFYREKIEELKKWQNSGRRKPLIVRGARQVGKTELLREFGRTQYEKMAYISFHNNSRMATLFSGDFDAGRLIQGLKAESNVDIEPENTLIILDEVQEVPNALAALKSFYENAPEYHIIVAGSLLGVAIHQGISFPVGKVDYLDLNPFSFREFLLALGEEQLARLLTTTTDPQLIAAFHGKFVEYLKTYAYIGGMPEVVKSYALEKSWNEARRIQKNILRDYVNDFSKHVPDALTRRIGQVWDSIPAQLAKENNKKFMYGLLGHGARAKEYETALAWLEDAGLIRKVNRIKAPRMPLRSYADASAFKVYHLDIGLLAAMTGLDERVLLEGSHVFTEFKGALAEQFALQEMANIEGLVAYYWGMDDSQAEIEFVVQVGAEIVPVEIKGGQNLRAKSLGVYIEKFAPRIAIRSSLADGKRTGEIFDVPIFLLREFLEKVKR